MEVLGFVCVAVVIGLLIGLAIGAVILRSACHLIGVPVPDFGKAMGVVFVTGLVTGLANFGVQFVLQSAMGGGPGSEGGADGPGHWVGDQHPHGFFDLGSDLHLDAGPGELR